MRTIQTSAGTAIELDGDLLAILEAISLDLKRSKGLDYDYEDVEHEFQHIVAQLSDDERKTYLKESLVMSFNRYENERLRNVVRRANEARDET